MWKKIGMIDLKQCLKKNLTYAEEAEQKDETDADGSLLFTWIPNFILKIRGKDKTWERVNMVNKGETGLAGGFGPGFRNWIWRTGALFECLSVWLFEDFLKTSRQNLPTAEILCLAKDPSALSVGSILPFLYFFIKS